VRHRSEEQMLFSLFPEKRKALFLDLALASSTLLKNSSTGAHHIQAGTEDLSRAGRVGKAA
jgi:hypothetical protein